MNGRSHLGEAKRKASDEECKSVRDTCDVKFLDMFEPTAPEEEDSLIKPLFGDIVFKRFPSLETNNKRNSKKRRKRDKTIPMHEMTTSVVLKFKSLHFAPLKNPGNAKQTIEDSDGEENSTSSQQPPLSSRSTMATPEEEDLAEQPNMPSEEMCSAEPGSVPTAMLASDNSWFEQQSVSTEDRSEC
jgi:hypothetical protein